MRKSWEMVDITNVEYRSTNGEANLQVFQPSDKSEFNICCHDVVFFKISNTIDDAATPWVADITLRELSQQSISTELNDLGYGWVECEYPTRSYHLHAEAGTVLDVICETISIADIFE